MNFYFNIVKSKIIIVIILIGSFSSCKKETQNSLSNTREIEEISLLDTLTLKLDNGKKWIVNNETQIGINKMDSIIKAFHNGVEKDYLKLGKDLSIQTGYIIRSCNMQGEAHDQLHVVLVPMLDKISVLKETNNKKESEIALRYIEELIGDYFKHFKL